MEFKDGAEENNIDFSLTQTRGQGNIQGSTECLEEIESTEEVSPYDVKNVKVQTVIEHICGKCYQFFRSIKSFERHMEFCNFNSAMILRREEMLKNIDKIEKEAIIMEKNDLCFCCGDSYDTCHLGHINCPDCAKTFKTQLSLERHMCLIHSEKADFPCTICNGKIRTAALLELHTEQHKTRGKPFACKICGKDFTQRNHLKRHENFSRCGQNPTEMHKCKACGREFYRLDKLRAHLKMHLDQQSTKKQEYMCPCCKNCFYSLSTLNIHIRTHTGERPFDCDLCEKNFPSLVSLKKHRRYHTGEKPYCCSVCNQHFAVKEVLNRHMKRHTDDKPHVCGECGKRFIQATQLKKHVNVHQRPYECTICAEKFKTERQIEKHLKAHNKLLREANSAQNIITRKKTSSGKYCCPDCDIQFFRRYSLLKHKKTQEHKEKATKTCKYCNEQFVGTKSLNFHMLKEHEFKCNQCDVVFIYSDLLQKHIEANHKTSLAVDKVVVEEDIGQDIEPIVAKVENQTPPARKVLTEHGCFVIEEFIIESLPADKMQTSTESKYTIIPKTSEALSQDSNTAYEESSKNLKVEFKKESVDDRDDKMEVEIKDDILITNNIGKLLDMLVDVKTLSKFGWPESSAEEVLCKVIENCGHNVNRNEFSDEYGARMREYVKLFFTVVIQNSSIEDLLNNYTIDEVIELVLSNEDAE